MNRTDWKKVEAFALDIPSDTYGFSTRLADENGWSIKFTQRAIIEYKKFMYLAATAGQMVSPSDVVDIVWHQHLIFTNAYHDFAKVLGKRIEHIPSTHNPEEREKFEFARKRTQKLYEEHFGEQPADIWKYKSLEHQIQATVAPLDPAGQKRNLGLVLLVFTLLFYPLFLIDASYQISIQKPNQTFQNEFKQNVYNSISRHESLDGL